MKNSKKEIKNKIFIYSVLILAILIITISRNAFTTPFVEFQINSLSLGIIWFSIIQLSLSIYELIKEKVPEKLNNYFLISKIQSGVLLILPSFYEVRPFLDEIIITLSVGVFASIIITIWMPIRIIYLASIK